MFPRRRSGRSNRHPLSDERGCYTGRENAALRKALDAYLKEKKLQAGLWTDLSLFKKVGEVTTKIRRAAEPLSFTLTVPSSLQKGEKDVTRTYFLLRVHDGKVSEIASSKDPVLNAESSEFSTYLLAYSDKKNGKKEDGKEDKGKDQKDKEKKKDKKKSAETGDE